MWWKIERMTTIPQKLAITDPKRVLAGGAACACYLDTADLSDRPPQGKEAGIRKERGGGEKKWKRKLRENFSGAFWLF